MTPILSVITPSWNRLHTLKKIPDALSKALFADELEWLCADDGSTDGTQEYLVSSYKSFPFRTTVILSSLRIGKSSLDNLLIRHSVGRFICWCDSDDLINCDVLPDLIRELKKLPADLLGICVPAYLPNGQTIGDWTSFTTLDVPLNQLSNYVIPNMSNCDGSIIFRASFLKSNPFPEVDFYAPESSVFEHALPYKFRCMNIPFLLKYYDFTGAITNKALIQYPFGYAIAELKKYALNRSSWPVRLKSLKSILLYTLYSSPTLPDLLVIADQDIRPHEYFLMILLLPFVAIPLLFQTRKQVFSTQKMFRTNKLKTQINRYSSHDYPVKQEVI